MLELRKIQENQKSLKEEILKLNEKDNDIDVHNISEPASSIEAFEITEENLKSKENRTIKVIISLLIFLSTPRD